jgi:hypothetical protein
VVYGFKKIQLHWEIAVADLIGTALSEAHGECKEIRERTIEIKMAKWYRRAKYEFLDPTCPPSKARAQLLSAMQSTLGHHAEDGLSEISVYR